MHPRNRYLNPPDFVALAQSYKPLRPHLINSHIDFKDAEAQRRLTEAIMLQDFGVTLHLSPNRLCPPVPNRLNYVLWIQDIVHAHNAVLKPHPRGVSGIDIGTGASVIYPLLVCKTEPSWNMVATELDDESYTFAQKNISINNLESRISLCKASASGRILFPLEDEVHFDFSMCNPPFYGSSEEVADLAQEKELPPNAVCTGADIEMVYPDGGEAGFVGRMVEESEKFQTRCKWYTSMLGKMSSAITLVDLFRSSSITNYALTEFVQGQTRRWAVAWSFTDTHLPDSIARIPSVGPGHALHPVLPPRTTLAQPFPGCTSDACLHSILAEILRSLSPDGVSASEVAANDTAQTSAFLIEAHANTWSRGARRSRRRQAQADSGASPAMTATLSSTTPALTCSARVIGLDNASRIPPYAVEFQWIFGQDRALFESFVSHVSRKIGVEVQERIK